MRTGVVGFAEPKSVVKDDALYFADNGACYCGKHLGMTARYTGRDLSGQKIERITPKVAEECRAMGFTPACENCGVTVEAGRLHFPSVIEVLPCVS